jgi:hypothetical protein
MAARTRIDDVRAVSSQRVVLVLAASERFTSDLGSTHILLGTQLKRDRAQRITSTLFLLIEDMPV